MEIKRNHELVEIFRKMIKAIPRKRYYISSEENLSEKYYDLIFASITLKDNNKILATAYKITNTDIGDAKDSNIEDRKKTGKTDYDCSTGNTHLSVERIRKEYEENFKIKQLVYCDKNRKHLGPKMELEEGFKPLSEKGVYITVPRANYYPMVEEVEDLTKPEIERQDYLKNIWNQIPGDYKEITK